MPDPDYDGHANGHAYHPYSYANADITASHPDADANADQRALPGPVTNRVRCCSLLYVFQYDGAVRQRPAFHPQLF
jgi:hypothetical protein